MFEIRQDSRYGKRPIDIAVDAAFIVPGVIALFASQQGGVSSSLSTGVAIVIFLLCMFGLFLTAIYRRFFAYRCPDCGKRIRKANIGPSPERWFIYICPQCNIRWETTLRLGFGRGKNNKGNW